MGYQKTNWTNGGSPAINDDNLNNIESGIEAAHKGTHIYAASATGNDTYVVTFATPFTAYNTGMIINLKVDVANTTASSINVDGLGAKTIKVITPSGKSDTLTGQILAGNVYQLIYDGTDFILMNPSSPAFFPVGTNGYALVSNGTDIVYGVPGVKAYAPDDAVLLTANTERSATALNTQTTVKTFTTGIKGKFRVKGQIKSNGSVKAYPGISQGGSGISEGSYTTSSGYVNFSFDMTGYVEAGTFNLYIRTESSITAYVQNVTICGIESVMIPSVDSNTVVLD